MEPNNNNSNTNYPTFQESQIEQSNPLGAYSDSPVPNSSQVYEKPSFQNPLIKDIVLLTKSVVDLFCFNGSLFTKVCNSVRD